MKKAIDHMYRHINVTPALVDRFADASRATQLRVLAQLRKRATDDSHTVELAIAAIAVSVLVSLTGTPHLDLEKLPWQVGLAAGGTLGLLVAGMLAPLVIGSAIRSNRRDSAVVWLRAYEDEVQRRAEADMGDASVAAAALPRGSTTARAGDKTRRRGLRWPSRIRRAIGAKHPRCDE